MKADTKNVYIVDDIQENLQVISNILIKEKLNISFARDGKQALIGITKKLPDLVLLDISMPEMDGFEVCTKLKENPQTACIPIIFLTARIQTEDIIKGFQLGAVDYITKPFNSEELLARVSTHLELKEVKDIIELQNKELTIKNKELEELNATKDKFFRIIGHDLKNPIAQIISFLDVLEAEIEDFNTEQILEFIKMLKTSTKTGFKLLENLLDWARSQTGAIEFCPETNSLDEMVEENIQLMNGKAKNKMISLINEVPKNTVVIVDKNMINTVLRNLISNAIKFTPENGSVIISSELKEKAIEITVSDTGVGINPDQIKKLFKIDVGHRTNGTNGEKGTGLGLLLCKEFIEKHDGELWIESGAGKGSKFKFLLPKT